MALFDGKSWFRNNLAPYLTVLKAQSVGRTSSTDNAIVRFNGATGLVQNSNVTISDTGYITSPAGALLRSSVVVKPTTADNHYGLIAVYAHESEIEVTTPRGAYFGYGHVGLQRVDLRLDGANQLYISGGKVKFSQDVILPSGAGLNKVLTSDSIGNATWQTRSKFISGNGQLGSIIESGMKYFGSFTRTKSYHIKTPYHTPTMSKMFHLTVKGFQYNSSRNYEFTVSGYSYASGGGILHSHAENYTESDAGFIQEIIPYRASDGHVWVKVKADIELSYHTVSCQNMLVGNGGAFIGDNEFASTDLNDASGDIALGDRTALITMTASAGLLQATFNDPQKLVDGTHANDTYFNTSVGTGLYLTAQFTTTRTIKAIAFKQSNTVSHGAVDFEISTDGTTWTNVGSVTDFVGYTRMPVNTPTAGTYFRIGWQGDTTSASPWTYELEFEE